MSAETSRKYRCIVCGRPFPRGQGIVLNFADEVLEFHSSRCFAKFARCLLERLPYDEIKGYVKKLREEYNELINERQKLKVKKIV